MNPLFAMVTSDPSSDWLVFLGMMLAICLPVGAFVIWLLVFRHRGKKQHRKNRKRHHRQLNPTLAQTGGLPPLRGPGEPPPGL